MHIALLPNENNSDRTALITITCGKDEVQARITQKATDDSGNGTGDEDEDEDEDEDIEEIEEEVDEEEETDDFDSIDSDDDDIDSGDDDLKDLVVLDEDEMEAE